jgi:outer membrane protein OmpA-like peptidoglycan-associated protein
MNRLIKVLLLVFFTSAAAMAQHNKESVQKTNKMKVEIWSDIVCPFCYIGKRHFESALKSFSNADDIEIVWKSYQLDPETPKQQTKQNVYEYLANRKGISVEQSKAMHDNVVKMAFSAGLNYDFDKATLRPESAASLDTLINFMKDNPSLSVEIYSHTDGKGDDKYNEKLSQARAESVVEYLKSNDQDAYKLLWEGVTVPDVYLFNENQQLALETLKKIDDKIGEFKKSE